MTRTFTVHDTPNDHGFARYTIRVDDGRPYTERVLPVSTDKPCELIKALLGWIEGEK